MADQKSEIRYLTAPSIDTKKKKYCRFKKSGIKYIDYKDPEFLKKFLNEQGKILPRRITGTSLKYQRRVAQAVKRARQIAGLVEHLEQVGVHLLHARTAPALAAEFDRGEMTQGKNSHKKILLRSLCHGEAGGSTLNLFYRIRKYILHYAM